MNIEFTKEEIIEGKINLKEFVQSQKFINYISEIKEIKENKFNDKIVIDLFSELGENFLKLKESIFTKENFQELYKLMENNVFLFYELDKELIIQNVQTLNYYWQKKFLHIKEDSVDINYALFSMDNDIGNKELIIKKQKNYGTKEFYKEIIETLNNLNNKTKCKAHNISFLVDINQEQKKDINYINFLLEFPELVTYRCSLLNDMDFCKLFLSKNPISVDMVDNNMLEKIDDELLVNKLSSNISVYKLFKLEKCKFHTEENLIKHLSYKKLSGKKLYKSLNDFTKKIPDFNKTNFCKNLISEAKKLNDEFEINENNVFNKSKQINNLVLLSNIREILNTSFFSIKQKTKENISNYYNECNKVNVSDDIYIDDNLILDIDYMIDVCKKYPNIKMEEHIKEIYIHNKNFACFYLEKVCNKAKSQNLNSIYRSLPTKIVTFLESVNIKENCLDFLKIYFEKKSLSNLIVKDTSYVEVNFIKTNHYLSIEKVNAVKPEKIIEKKERLNKL